MKKLNPRQYANAKEFKERYQSRQIKRNRNGYVRLNVPDFLRLYIRDPRRKADYISEVSIYRGIIEGFFKKVWREMLNNGWVFRAPANFGWFYITETYGNPKFIDWPKTQERGELVYRSNFHTDGRIFYTKWHKVGRLINKSLYGKRIMETDDEDAEWGKTGIHNHIMKLAKDPTKPDFRGVRF